MSEISPGFYPDTRHLECKWCQSVALITPDVGLNYHFHDKQEDVWGRAGDETEQLWDSKNTKQSPFNVLQTVVSLFIISTGSLLNTPSTFSPLFVAVSSDERGKVLGKFLHQFCLIMKWAHVGQIIIGENNTQTTSLLASEWTQLLEHVGATSVQSRAVTHLKLFHNHRNVTSAVEQVSLNRSLAS